MKTGLRKPLRAVAFAAAAVGLSAPLPALAYIDPGTGSMLLQSLLAAIAMAAGGIAVFFGHIKSFFSRFQTKGKKDAPKE
jgi:hypothetical protein